MTAGLFAAVKTATDFDKAMSGVRASLDPGDIAPFGAQLDALAISLGANTSFNALETAAAIEELAKAGIPAQSIIEGVARSTLDLAAATGTKPAEAAAVATAAMNTFKLGVKELPDVVNKLAGVTNATSADLGDLRLGLSQAGAVAALAGLSFTDTATALGLFANSGLRGSDAGTSLKTMFLNLQPQTKAQVAEARKLGLLTAQGTSAFFDQTGKVKNLSAVAGILNRAYSGMSREQRLASAEILFGSDAMRAAAILSEAGATGVDKLSASIGGISAQAQAQERLNNLSGDIEQFNGAIQTAGITIGRVFMPELRRLAQFGTRIVNAFNGMTDGQKRFVTIAAAVVGVTLSLIGGFVLLAPFVLASAAAFPALLSIMSVLLPVVGLVALAVKAMADAWKNDVGGIQGIVQNAIGRLPDMIQKVRDETEIGRTLWESYKVKLEELAGVIDGRLGTAYSNLHDGLEQVRAKAEEVNTALGKIRDAAPAAFTKATADLDSGTAQLGVSAQQNATPLSAIGGGATGAAAGLVILGPALGLVNTALQIGARVAPLFSEGLAAIGTAVLANPIGLLIVGILALAGALFAVYLTNETFRESVNGLFAELAPIGDVIGQAFDGLQKFAVDNGPAILTFFQNLGNAIGDNLGKQVDSLRPFVHALADFVVQFLLLDAAIARVAGSAIGGFFENVLGPGLELLLDVLKRMLPFLEPVFNLIRDLLAQFRIGDLLVPVTNALEIMAGIFERIRTALDGLVLPDFLRSGSGANVFGNRPPAGVDPNQAVSPAAALAEGNNTGPLVDIGTVNIANDADGEKFINSLVDRFRQAARRISAPIPPGQPGVVTGNSGAQ